MAVANAQHRTDRRSGLGGLVDDLNGRHHRIALWGFMAIVIAHWAEHVVQAAQIFLLGWERPDSRGVLGQFFPWLARSESLHYFYAIVMLIGLILLRPGFAGRARTWWTIALAIQVWHHFEHLLLVGQAVTGTHLFGRQENVSILQLVVPRVELHLFYNVAVFIPMVIAMLYHVYPTKDELHQVSCTCAKESRRPALATG
jgi:hypothetical protein